MQITVDRHQQAVRAVLCAVALLLTPLWSGAETISTAEAPRTSGPLNEHRAMRLHDPLAGDLQHALPTTGTRLDALRDRAIEESIAEGHPSATVLSPFRAPIPSSDSGTSSPANPTLMQELSHTVKETLRPTYVEALNSGVVDTIRSVASGDRPDPSADFKDVNAGDPNEANRRPQATEGRTWDSGNGSARPLTDPEKTVDKVRAEILLMALIDEITPWAITAAGLYGLYHLAWFGLAYLRRKSGRHRRRHRSGGSSSGSRSGRSHRRRSHSAPRSAPVKLDNPDNSPVHSPAP